MSRHWWKEEQAVEAPVVVHEAEEGGYWAEVHAHILVVRPRAETMEESTTNVHEAIEACPSVEVEQGSSRCET